MLKFGSFPVERLFAFAFVGVVAVVDFRFRLGLAGGRVSLEKRKDQFKSSFRTKFNQKEENEVQSVLSLSIELAEYLRQELFDMAMLFETKDS